MSDLSDLSDKMSAPVFALTGYAVASHVIPRGFAVPQCGLARAIDLPVGCADKLMATAVCVLRGCDACMGIFGIFLGFFGRVIGAPCDTPWVCCAAVWNGSGEDVPLGYARLF